jgi:RNA polymerase sigma-70 factor (ECF subfamily)
MAIDIRSRQGTTTIRHTTISFGPRATTFVLIWYGLLLAFIWVGALKSTACVHGMPPARRVRGMAEEGATGRDRESDAAELSLMQHVQAGDAEAFAILFQRYVTKVYRQAVCLLSNPAEAEEVTQEVFLALYEKAHTFRGEAALSTWLYRLTANAALSRLRRRRRRREIALEDYLPRFQENGRHLVRPVMNQAHDFDERLASAEAHRLLQEAIDQLRPVDQAVVVLNDLEGFSHREIGEALGLSVSAVKARLHRARLFLRGRLAAALGREPS